MPKVRLTLALFLAAAAQRCAAQTPIVPGSSAIFASADEGRRLLTQRDDYINSTTPFDRAARLKSADDVSVDQFVEFIGKNVRDWPDDERARLEAALAAIRPKLVELAVPLPETVVMVTTTGDEEGGAFYTRGAAIVFPAPRLTAAREYLLQRTLAHELFHVLSRSQPELREKLYATIGFVPCGEVAMPPSLADRRIANPDAPRNDHAVEVELAGQKRWAVPIIYSKSEKYDANRGDEFYKYIEVRLLAVDLPPERSDPNTQQADAQQAAGQPKQAATPTLVDGQPLLADPKGVASYFEKVGRNTQYIIHPEEILAENFAMLVGGDTRMANPEILERIAKILQAHAAEAKTPAPAPADGK